MPREREAPDTDEETEQPADADSAGTYEITVEDFEWRPPSSAD